MTIRTYPFGWLTPYLLPVFRKNPSRLDDYLALTRADWHYVGLIFGAMGASLRCPDHFSAVERDLLWRPRREMLAEVACGAPAGVLRLLPKLSGSLWRPPSYQRLLQLAAEPTALKAIRAKPAINRRFIRTLSKLPPALRCEAALRQVAGVDDVDRLMFALDVVKRVRTDLTEDAIIRSLSHVRGKGYNDWVVRHYQKAPFPPAPWGGTPQLAPVRSYRGLKKLALEFDNCVRDYHLEVLDGRSYFYRLEDDNGPSAAIELQSLPQAGWVVAQVEGVKNEPVSKATMACVRSSFASVGIRSMPRDTRRWDFF